MGMRPWTNDLLRELCCQPSSPNMSRFARPLMPTNRRLSFDWVFAKTESPAATTMRIAGSIVELTYGARFLVTASLSIGNGPSDARTHSSCELMRSYSMHAIPNYDQLKEDISGLMMEPLESWEVNTIARTWSELLRSWIALCLISRTAQQ